MAMEAAVYQQDPFLYSCVDFNYITEFGEFGVEEKVNVDTSGDRSTPICYWDSPPSSIAQNSTAATCSPESRPKRRRSKTLKNKEEVESQRMTHIAVERNRRRQMNDYLAVLRSLMPPSYAPRGDQASIVGGAIDFVKELEQLLQFLQAYKFRNQEFSGDCNIFSDCFTLPQYSRKSSIAEIEVTMVESHASVKIFMQRSSKLLVKMVAGFESIHLNILHLTVTTVDQSVLYSFTVKVEDECELNTVKEIARAVHDLIGRIQQDSTLLASVAGGSRPAGSGPETAGSGSAGP